MCEVGHKVWVGHNVKGGIWSVMWGIKFKKGHTFQHHINMVGFPQDVSTSLDLCYSSKCLLAAFLHSVSTLL